MSYGDRLTPSVFEGSISGTPFELSDHDLALIQPDVPVVACVVLHPGSVQRGWNKNQDRYERVKFNVGEFVIVDDPNLRERIMDAFPTIEMGLPFPLADRAPTVDTETGEIVGNTNGSASLPSEPNPVEDRPQPPAMVEPYEEASTPLPEGGMRIKVTTSKDAALRAFLQE